MNIPVVSNTNFKIPVNNQSSQTTAPQNNTLAVKDTQNDSWNFSINKKKIAKIAIITTALATIAGSAIYAIRRGKAPKEAKELIKEANKFTESFREKFQSTIDEVTTLYKNGGKDANGKVVATITEDIEYPARKLMAISTKEGEEPSIISVFINDKLGSVEKLRDDGKFDTVFINEKEQISHCREGIKYTTDKMFTIEKEAFLENNKPFLYTEGQSVQNDSKTGVKSFTKKAVCISEKGKPISYKEDCKMDETGYTAKIWMALMGNGLSKRWYNIAEGIHKAQ